VLTIASTDVPPLVLINAVGLTSRWLEMAPRLSRLAGSGWSRPLEEIVPAVTCSAQASLLTGLPPERHGVVGNGWLFRETGEIRFWQQSNALIQAEPIYTTARRLAARHGRRFRAAKIFWWFNQGADVAASVTPKPHYGADGNKVFGITGTPAGFAERVERELGPFPFQTFWGPNSGLPSTEWIARCASHHLEAERPDLSLVYLPHLDYDPQRFGPSGSDMPRLVAELDDACAPLLDAAAKVGARVWVVSEYGHCDVSRPILLNRRLRETGFLSVRPGPFGEALDTFESRAFAVCDHQIAHVYVSNPDDIAAVSEVVASEPGVAKVHAGENRREIGLDHTRSGELIALSERDAWFAYPFWINDRDAPDYARTIDIHRKPGYDPCELFFDPKLWWPKGRAIRRLIQKKIGFRTLFDIIPLDPSLVRGSHGVPALDPRDRPILIADGPAPDRSPTLKTTDVHAMLVRALVPEEG
jgi:predicted AlkP superfamily pyrophosphatase or phosphodiesterase